MTLAVFLVIGTGYGGGIGGRSVAQHVISSWPPTLTGGRSTVRPPHEASRVPFCSSNIRDFDGGHAVAWAGPRAEMRAQTLTATKARHHSINFRDPGFKTPPFESAHNLESIGGGPVEIDARC